RPLSEWLERPDVTDILINAPGEVWVETLGGETQRHAAPELTDTILWRLAGQIAAAAHQGVSREHPLLAATLPDGGRVQIVAPPATRGPMAIAIIGGIIVSTLLSLVVVPAFFVVADRVKTKAKTTTARSPRLA
ncbi:MAG: Flp pilus assembly complex ATPase component TadA, partial [Actinobacteria bacterium]|nr:Flp pilus assembly complex ATPase component TadA [Actinomycetota bacterium]